MNYLFHLPVDLQRLVCLRIFPLGPTIQPGDEEREAEPISSSLPGLLLAYSELTGRSLAGLLEVEFGASQHPEQLQRLDLLTSRLEVNYTTVLDVKFSRVIRLGFLKKYQEYLSVCRSFFYPNWGWPGLVKEYYDSRVTDQVVLKLVNISPNLCFRRNSVYLVNAWFQQKRPAWFLEYTSYVRYHPENEAAAYYQRQVSTIYPEHFAYLMHNFNPSITIAALIEMERRVDYRRANHYLAPWLMGWLLSDCQMALDYYLFWLEFLIKCKNPVPTTTWVRVIHRNILKIIRRRGGDSWVEHLRPLYQELFRYPINSGAIHQQCYELKNHVDRGFVQGLIQDLVKEGRLAPTPWLRQHDYIL